jgi:hypothetical protein
MPESRGRKPKKQNAAAAQTAKPKVAAAESTRAAQPKRRVGKVIGVLITLFTVFTGAVGLSWTPKMRQLAKVEPCP